MLNVHFLKKRSFFAHIGPCAQVSPLCARSGRCLHYDILIYGELVTCLALRMKADIREKNDAFRNLREKPGRKNEGSE